MSDLEDTSDSFSDENPSVTVERVDGISAKMTLSIAGLLPDRKKLLKILAAALLLVIGVVVWMFMSRDGSSVYSIVIDAGSTGSRIHVYTV